VIVGTADIILDAPTSLLSVHIAFEVLIVVMSLGAALFLARGWYASQAQVARLAKTLDEQHHARDAWRRSALESLEGLGAAIDRQFEAWSLTAAEREIALLLLKGHGSKQIAATTRRSDRTIRQHAAAVYRKSGLGGRAALAAFFLEGLFLPPTSTTAQRSPFTHA
jgi:DNA-binding NarL/FixJ family response regulator